MMTNDISTLNGALNELGETLADNLSQMGVDDAVASDGLTTLANKILDIEPSVAGLELSTSIDCNVSSNKILLGQSVVFSATLSASYDDTSIEDIDISGVLTGATVLFKTSGGVILGSGVTDVNGVATYTHTFEDMGSIVVHAEFGGSTNFNSCISQNDVTVECSYDFDVTVDKEILSANDNDVATFNCRLSDGIGGVGGESIDYRILHNDIVLSSGSRVTNENGEITLEYAATGVGNVDVIFSLRSILQKTYELEDCLKVYPNTYTSSTNLDYALPNVPFEIAFTLTRQSGVGYVRVGTNTNNCILFGQVGNDGSNGIARMKNGVYNNLILSSIAPQVNVPIDIKCQFNGSTYKYFIDNDTVSYDDARQELTTLLLVYCTNSNNIQNLRIKAL